VYLNVDVDNLWNYELEFGSPPSGKNDLIFEEAMPKMLELFAKHKARATFFVVGRDLETPSCQNFCKVAARAGHEIANHSYSHLGTPHRLSLAEKEKEILRCHELIEKYTGAPPVGFRGPGYYIDSEMIQILQRENYLYDSSVLPSFANQMMSLYILLRTGRRIDKMFGRKRWMVASQEVTKIAGLQSDGRWLYELPVTTAPLLRWPIHTTYLYMFGTKYFEMSLPKLRDQQDAVFLFHAVDTLDYREDANLARNLLALKKPLDERLKMFDWILASFQQTNFIPNREGLSRLRPEDVPTSRLLSSRGGRQLESAVYPSAK
jgi:peptidoglycan/xylan/chitin deacetylase (PgdA/CDA1 family)